MSKRIIKLAALGFLAAGVAQAGFRDPVQSSGGRAVDLTNNYSKNIGSPSANAANGAANFAAAKQSSVTPMRAPASPVQAVYGPMPPKNIPAARNGAAPAQASNYGPVPRAPGLPGSTNVNIPSLSLPGQGGVTIHRDLLPPVEMTARNRAQLHNFSRQARLQLLPTHTYPEQPRSMEIVSRFSAALNPKPHQTIRTPIKLTLAKIAKILNPPSPIQYENMVKRLDALFDGIYLQYPAGIASLWELSTARNNAKALQARDALFAAILSERAGWETVAGNLLEDSAKKHVDAEERYLGILFKELDAFQNISHIDRVIASVNPVKAKLLEPMGDKANYAMARRVLAGKANPAVAADTFESRIEKVSLRERLDMIRALSHLRVKDGKKADAIAMLTKLEAEGEPELIPDARLALARAKLQNGSTQEALDLYRRITKTSENRLEVLGEQSYAEYRAGLHQDSLGKSMGLQSPYFQYGFAPDIHLIEILSRKAMCDFGGAETGIQRFTQRYTPELQALQGILAKKGNPQAFYEELISYHAKAEPMRFQRFLLRMPAVMENQKTLNSAVKEFVTVDSLGLKRHTVERPKAWNDFLVAMHASWNAKSGALKDESARSALNEAEYMVKRLRSTFAQLELLSLDVATGASKNFNVQSAMNFPVRKLASEEIKDDRFHWPFEDEIWEDELDFLKMKNPSKCAGAAVPQQQASATATTAVN